MNLLIKALCEFALLEEAASCISKYLEFFSANPNASLHEFVKAVVNYLAQESVREMVKEKISLAGVVKEISENYTLILNKVLCRVRSDRKETKRVRSSWRCLWSCLRPMLCPLSIWGLRRGRILGRL
eukprot:TRINITY_DN18937_c0_g1_i2.p1 TRINITY_DN18937_c0_g1~~TRINITY_DN18937_c0_g1_i2.p1  ORF type:complete len:127 (-),score=19.89 TRINITY_DN18937_c0_g1_i2:418-798(-)